MKTRTQTVPIMPSRSYLRWVESGDKRIEEIAWERSPAFAVNPRGVMTHRVRHVSTIVFDERAHHHVHYLCGNGCNVNADRIDDVLVADPPEHRLLCEACERQAKRHDLPSGDRLAGRHVHRGVLVPKRTCCGGSS